MAVLTTVTGRNMIDRFPGCSNAIVAAKTRPKHVEVINSNGGIPRRFRVAVAASVGRGDVIGWLCGRRDLPCPRMTRAACSGCTLENSISVATLAVRVDMGAAQFETRRKMIEIRPALALRQRNRADARDR